MAELTNALAQEAVKLFKSGLYCSEAILKVFNDHLQLGLNEAAIKMATGFGAGLGASKCCCGSLTGAVMVLSAINGRTTASEAVDEVFALTAYIHDEFKARFKASCCRVLTKHIEWGSPQHHIECEKYVYGAVEILLEALNKNSTISNVMEEIL